MSELKEKLRGDIIVTTHPINDAENLGTLAYWGLSMMKTPITVLVQPLIDEDETEVYIKHWSKELPDAKDILIEKMVN